MSTFGVTIETIGEIREHTNADRLEMATLNGKDYDFVVMKGQFRPGDVVVYFPVDSILPEWVTDALGLTGKLSGKEQNRVKTIKLRGNLSQGVVAAPSLFAERLPDILTAQPGADITALLGVEKYEPPPIPSQHGILRPLPQFVGHYDIESAQNYVDLMQALLDAPVSITEKLEGSHWAVSYLAETDTVTVSQRNHRIEPNDQGEHDWHKAARLGNFGDKLRAIAAEWAAQTGHAPKAITVRGEMIGPGIQGNYYRLKEQAVCAFEIEIDGTPLDAETFMQLARAYDIAIVPVLAHNVILREWLDGKTIKQASDGRSQIADLPREGIVIKPMVEQANESLGRVVLKQRSPEYLSKSEY